jgi:hypothetical protein
VPVLAFRMGPYAPNSLVGYLKLMARLDCGKEG